MYLRTWVNLVLNQDTELHLAEKSASYKGDSEVMGDKI